MVKILLSVPTWLKQQGISKGVMNQWTGLLDWTTGVEYWNDLYGNAHVQ